MNNLFRSLPSVDACLSGLENAAPVLYATTPRPLLRSLTNAFLDGCRRDIKEGRLTDSGQLGLDALLPRLAAFAEKEAAPRFRRVLNATGVVIHTNMGRSVLADEAVNAILKACRGYSNLELNLATGERGSRYSHVEELLCTLTGAEAALVVNNNAAAVLINWSAAIASRRVLRLMSISCASTRSGGSLSPMAYRDAITDSNASTASMLFFCCCLIFGKSTTNASLLLIWLANTLPRITMIPCGGICRTHGFRVFLPP